MSATAFEIVAILRGYRFNAVTEADLHNAIAGALTREHIDFEREVRLTARDRIDFLLDAVGIEVKVDGSTAAVERQLKRYAEHEQIPSLILLTGCARHAGVARVLNGKPVYVVATFGGTA